MVDPYAVAQDALKLVQLIVRKCDEVKALKTELTPLKDNLESLGGILQNVGEVHYETIPPLKSILARLCVEKSRSRQHHRSVLQVRQQPHGTERYRAAHSRSAAASPASLVPEWL